MECQLGLALRLVSLGATIDEVDLPRRGLELALGILASSWRRRRRLLEVPSALAFVPRALLLFPESLHEVALGRGMVAVLVEDTSRSH